jgi:hypothetical protein
MITRIFDAFAKEKLEDEVVVNRQRKAQRTVQDFLLQAVGSEPIRG